MNDKSKQKFEVLGKQELLAEAPLPMAEVWEELQAPADAQVPQARFWTARQSADGFQGCFRITRRIASIRFRSTLCR